MNKKDYAISCFNKGFNCSQAVLSMFSKELGLSSEIALKISCGFGGGMKQGETCGAVTGALMVIGLKYGPKDPEDKLAKEKTYTLIEEFLKKFRLRNGSVICKELLECDISTEEGMRIAEEKELFVTQCPKFVVDAIEIIEEICNL
ncbi:C_GCAxxG_C_C family protein [Caloranaerobacter sp. TR13]|uniref:C-GCAxxG-C-C family protein n=1 Tax=Caloranaerobacter sp. TR13 TaxID=1302151 RepID=UPI0006D40407|nr:C-GCAxxG-C-C family protein [Caloranaerobacter sp. TR13]KPU27707.1 C_GCAxxG_C_C family protein [Caloranaerobacter sp. TR13]